MRFSLIFISSLALAQSIPATSDEWVGPFASWTNVKTACNATGNGSTDDSTAIQNCLNLFTTDNTVSPTLYFPAGNYKIVTGLTLAHRINIQFIGHSNSDTTITWAGSNGGTMLDLNGVAYSKFSRFTFNGNSTSGYCIDQSWDGTGNYFDTVNEFSDIIFDHCQIAFRCGFLGNGCAETSMLRDQFLHASVAGVALYNFNALDMWIWYSTFDTCAIGVTNALSGAGNFHVYNSNFLHTVGDDMSIAQTGGFSARNNYSIGANRFFEAGFTGNPSNMTLQGNTVLDTVDPSAIYFQNEGPQLFMDNVFRSSSANNTNFPVLHSGGSPQATSTLKGNTFGNGNTLAQNVEVQWTIESDDVAVSRASINPSQPTLPPELPNLGRTITDVSTKTGAAIQSAINTACVSNGTRPVVHLPYGNYFVSSTITVPVCDVQVIGDGMGDVQGTFLIWNGAGAGPVVSISGPSRATFRDLEVNGGGTADGIVLNSADQVGGRVYTDQLFLAAAGNTTANLNVNGLDNAFLEFENYEQTAAPSFCTGGPNKQSGLTAGRVDIFSGATSGGSGGQFDVTSGCTFLIRDLWYESGSGPGFVYIHGKNTFTLDGARVAPNVGGNPSPFNIVGLNGLATITEADIDQGIAISGSGTNANLLAISDVSHISSGAWFVDTTSPAATANMLNGRNYVSPIVDHATDPTNNIGTASDALLTTMLAQDRAEAPAVLTALSTSLTDARFFRVRAYNGVTNFKINATSGAGTGGSSYSSKITFGGPLAGN